MTNSVQTMLLDHLTALYGVQTAEHLSRRIQDLIRRHTLPAQAKARETRAELTEKDVLLITYGDQITESDRPPLQTLEDFLRHHCSEVISGVHLLPFYPYTSDDGFAVTDFFEVNPALGSWEDIARIGKTFDLMMDGVFNHLSAQSNWFTQFTQGHPAFRDFFITIEGDPDLTQVIRPRALPLLTSFHTAQGIKRVWTTFSADQVDLNFKNPEVLLAVLDVLLFYVAHGARFIRLDAIAFLWKEIGTLCLHLPQTHRIIQLFRTVLDQAAPEVFLITETNVPHLDNLSYFGNGYNEAQLIYNFALPPLVLHTLRTGSASHLSRWAASLQLPSSQPTFLNFLASHDGIGLNPVRGILSPEEIDGLVRQTLAHGGFVSNKHNPDGSQSPYELNITYFDALSDPSSTEPFHVQMDRFMSAQAIMLALAGVPAIYFHSLFGSRNDGMAVRRSGIPRRINRQKFTRTELEYALNDPQSMRSQVFDRFQKLLALRRRHPAFHPQGHYTIFSEDDCIFALLRISPDESEHVLCLHNITSASHSVTLQLPGQYAHSHWRCLATFQIFQASTHPSLTLTLEPYATLWMERTDLERAEMEKA